MSLQVERLVLGAVLAGKLEVEQAFRELNDSDFSLESNKRIFRAMLAVHERGDRVDRVLTFIELKRLDLHDAVGGLSYLVSLDEDLPAIPSVHGYIETLRRMATLRRLAMFGSSLRDRCLLQAETPEELLATAEQFLREVAESTSQSGGD